jgi:hypothetical protein
MELMVLAKLWRQRVSLVHLNREFYIPADMLTNVAPIHTLHCGRKPSKDSLMQRRANFPSMEPAVLVHQLEEVIVSANTERLRRQLKAVTLQLSVTYFYYL